jgi:hypothetical protein
LGNKFFSRSKHISFRQLAHLEKTRFQRSVFFKQAVSMDMAYLETCLAKLPRNQQGSMAIQRIFFRAPFGPKQLSAGRGNIAGRSGYTDASARRRRQ